MSFDACDQYILTTLKTEELISGCKKGDIKAQKMLFLKYKDMVYTSSLKYCKNHDEAEDNVHDVFIALFEGIKKYKSSGSFEGWIKRIAIYKAIDKFKRKKPFRFSDQMNTKTEDVLVSRAYANIPLDFVLNTINELPQQYRVVFNLYQLDDYSHKEISNILGISEGTSKSNLHRAKQILKEKLSLFSTQTKVALNYE